MKKIYTYKDGRAFFENDVKMAISDAEYDLLYNNNGVYRYVEYKCQPNKYTEAKLSVMLEYVRNNNLSVVVREHKEEEITITYILENGELVYFTNGELETEKGDENWNMFCEEMKNVDADMFN